MIHSMFFYKQLTKAEVGQTGTHEIYIRLSNGFDYETFFGDTPQVNENGTITIYFEAIDTSKGLNETVNVPIRFVYYSNSNKEKRIPSLSELFKENNVEVDDIVCLESRRVDDKYSFYIRFFKKGTIRIDPSSFSFTTVDDENKDNIISTDKSITPLQQIFYGAPGTGKSFGIKRALVNNNVLSYLSAIRTKPFLLLAGISGTGKSRIVKEMAYASCPDEGDLRKDKTSPGNYCLVEVKPNWNDSTELLGYETVLDGGNYHLTKFVKFLIKAMQHENVPFFVCLDEMNLAAVEQYFAEFLSILESRKDVDGTIKSEPLIPAAIFEKYQQKLHKELFPTKYSSNTSTGAGCYTTDDGTAVYLHRTYAKLMEEGLRIPRNLIVVGTVNMDDTTYQFSRKVIDRAMTIEMNEVNLNDMFDIEKPDALSYREDVVDKGWFFAPFAQSNNALQQMNDERELLVEKIKATIGQTDADGTTTPDSLEAILGKTPFRIAYRVVNELILHFYALRMEDKDADFEELYNKALDNILMMKVLPRIEGNEDLVKEPLAQLATWTEVAYPKANAKIVEMRERLERSHFTSFWP